MSKKNFAKSITGKDLEAFAEQYELTMVEACACFGIVSPNKWYALIRNDEHLEPSLALLVRLYNKYPELIPIEKDVEPLELYDKCQNFWQEGHELTKTDFSLLIGRDASAVTRWDVREQTPTLIVRRLMKALDKITDDEDDIRFKAYIRLIREEAAVRDVNVFTEKKWRTVDNKEK